MIYHINLKNNKIAIKITKYYSNQFKKHKIKSENILVFNNK